MKRILLILLMIGGIAYGQCPEVTGLSVSNLTTTGGKASYTAAAGATLYVWGIYVPGGTFVTGGSTTSTTFNFTGLSAATTYRLKVKTTCGLSVSSDDSLTFSTLSAGVMYTPLGAAGYQMKYAKIDSVFNLPLHDTIISRGINQAGAQVYKPGSGVFVYTGSYWQGISSGSGTIIITDSSRGIDSITFNGYMECIYLHDSITPTCWQLNRFFDDVRLSDDSLWYKYYNDGTVIDSVPSGIKTFGLVWPLSTNGVDITVSQHYFDSLYLSSLVIHGTNLYSKKLTGDSVLVGTIGGGGILHAVGSQGLSNINDSTIAIGGTITSDRTIEAGTKAIYITNAGAGNELDLFSNEVTIISTQGIASMIGGGLTIANSVGNNFILQPYNSIPSGTTGATYYMPYQSTSFLTIPISVNGNYANAAGNITISAGGSGGISKVGSPAFGLTRTNDSTYFVDTASTSILSRQRAAATYQPIGSYLTIANLVRGETPTGTINGVNQDFTLANTPVLFEDTWISGVHQNLTTHYTVTGTTLHFITAPVTGSDIKVNYIK